jgi:hypothetical protein
MVCAKLFFSIKTLARLQSAQPLRSASQTEPFRNLITLAAPRRVLRGGMHLDDVEPSPRRPNLG